MSGNVQEKKTGSTKKRTAAVVISSAQVGLGCVLIIYKGPVGRVAGAGFIGSGLSSGFKMLTSKPEDLTLWSYIQECMVGGVTGTLAGGVSAAGASITEVLGLTGFNSVIFTLVAESTAGAIGQVTAHVGRNIIDEKGALENVNWADFVTGAMAGGLSFGLGQVASTGVNQAGNRLLSEAVEEGTERMMLSSGQQVLLDTVTGSVGGAVGSAAATTVRNVAEGKEALDGVGSAALTGATIGAAVAAGRSVKKVRGRQFISEIKTAKVSQLVKNSDGTGLAIIEDKLYKVIFNPSGQPEPVQMIDPNAYDLQNISMDIKTGKIRWQSSIDKQWYEGDVYQGELRHTTKGESVSRPFAGSETVSSDGLTVNIKETPPSVVRAQSDNHLVVFNKAISKLVTSADGRGLAQTTDGRLYEVFVKPGSQDVRFDRLIDPNAWDMTGISLKGSRIRWQSSIDGQWYEGAVRQGRLSHNVKGEAVVGHFPESKVLNPSHFSIKKPSSGIETGPTRETTDAYFLSKRQFAVIANELKKHVVLVHAVNHHNAIGGYYGEEFHNLYGGRSEYDDVLVQCQFMVEKEIDEKGVIGHFLDYEVAAFNKERGMLDRPHTHWAWNQLVQPLEPARLGDWEHCRVAILEPLSNVPHNSYYAVAPYDTQMTHPHRLSQDSVLLLPDSMRDRGLKLPNFQGRVVYYASEKSLRSAVAETLQTHYPQVWPIVDEEGTPCAEKIHRSPGGYRSKTILKETNGELLVLLTNENSQLHSAMREMNKQGKFIGLHASSVTYLLESDEGLVRLMRFMKNKDPGVFTRYPRAFIRSVHATRDTLIIKSAYQFYERMLPHREPVLSMYVIQQAAYADFLSLFHQAGLAGIPSQSEMYLLFPERIIHQVQKIIADIYTNQATVESYRAFLNSRLLLARQQRELPREDMALSDESELCGDSLFDAVAAQIQMLMKAKDLRVTTAAYLALYKDKYAHQLPRRGVVQVGSGKQSLKYGNFDQYCEYIQTPQVWASCMEAQAIAYALDRPVMIIEPGRFCTPTIFNQESVHSPIILMLMYQKMFASVKSNHPEGGGNTFDLYVALGGERVRQRSLPQVSGFFKAGPNMESKKDAVHKEATTSASFYSRLRGYLPF